MTDSCYMYEQQAKNWTHTGDTCREKNAHLLEINNQAEQEVVEEEKYALGYGENGCQSKVIVYVLHG